jgi:hypothetical protein
MSEKRYVIEWPEEPAVASSYGGELVDIKGEYISIDRLRKWGAKVTEVPILIPGQKAWVGGCGVDYVGQAPGNPSVAVIVDEFGELQYTPLENIHVEGEQTEEETI